MRLGQHMTDEQRAKDAAWHLGRHLSEEHKAKISAANIGRVVSAETRAKISAAEMGKPGYTPTAEQRARQSALLTGHVASTESRERMSKAQTGHPVSDEARVNMSRARMGKRASDETRAKMSAMRKGSLSPSWKGGITPENVRLRTTDSYVAWRMAVFARDGYTCQKCGEKGCALVAHHMDGFADFPEKRLDVNNGITLCDPCHRIFHRKYGRLHNGGSQVDEFLAGGAF